MNCDASSDFLIYNGQYRSTADTDTFCKIDAKSIYEVIKLIGGIPLYFEDHIDRLRLSAEHLGIEITKSTADIRDEIALLVEKNRLENINVKLVFTHRNEMSVFLTYFVRQDFPKASDYKKGTRTILYAGERKDPHLKTIESSYRERVRNLRQDAGAYEALLVNENGFISEGTRSNLFFLKNDQLFTPPSGEALLGVTRRHVLKVCSKLGIAVKEQLLHQDDLGLLQGAFITGTTIDVLPIGHIDDLYLPSVKQPIITQVAEEFSTDCRKYIAARQGSPSKMQKQA